MTVLIWLILLFLLIFILYTQIKYWTHPKKKLKKAFHNGSFYFLDNSDNIRENFFITYKGHLFQGEKYTDNYTNASDVHSIFIWSEQLSSNYKISQEDILYIERIIHSSYPFATINWKNTSTE